MFTIPLPKLLVDYYNWINTVEEEAENAVNKCFAKEKFDYVIVNCGYTYSFDKGKDNEDDFVNLNALCTESRINPKFKKVVRLSSKRINLIWMI